MRPKRSMFSVYKLAVAVFFALIACMILVAGAFVTAWLTDRYPNWVCYLLADSLFLGVLFWLIYFAIEKVKNA